MRTRSEGRIDRHPLLVRHVLSLRRCGGRRLRRARRRRQRSQLSCNCGCGLSTAAHLLFKQATRSWGWGRRYRRRRGEWIVRKRWSFRLWMGRPLPNTHSGHRCASQEGFFARLWSRRGRNHWLVAGRDTEPWDTVAGLSRSRSRRYIGGGRYYRWR